MPGKKTNQVKHPYVREQWIKAKREGRPKQRWIWDVEPVVLEDGTLPGIGHWEKVMEATA